MVLLNIYSLDDIECKNIIACLPEGKHVIGRGDLLKVTDKRVSRKHAIIEVSSHQISLTSIHVNPCFFKAANGKTLSVISQNQQGELNDGDQFALLPESCWFKLKIKREEVADEDVNGLGNTDTEANGKRIRNNSLEENSFNSDTKRAKISLASHEDKSNELQPQIKTENTGDDEQNKDVPSGSGTAAKNVTKDVNDSTTSNITLEVSNNDHNNGTSHIQEANTGLDGQVEANTLQNQSEIKQEDHKNESINRNIKEKPGDNENEKFPEMDNANTPNQAIKEEPLNDINNEEPHPPNDLLRNEDESNKLQPQIKTENTGNDDQNKDVPSGSGTADKNVRRERCFYGAQCFRKNPNHRQAFSHPGDNDYDSDPDDDRPDCPYGAACYRQNPEHRREYKHVGGPAPKPSNATTNLIYLSSGSCPYCEHCQRKNGGGGKEDSESDVDDYFYE